MIEKNQLHLESLPQESTVNQLKKLRKLTKGVDVGDKISNMEDEGANIMWIHNPVDTGIESYQDYIRSGRVKKRKSKKIKRFREMN